MTSIVSHCKVMTATLVMTFGVSCGMQAQSITLGNCDGTNAVANETVTAGTDGMAGSALYYPEETMKGYEGCCISSIYLRLNQATGDKGGRVFITHQLDGTPIVEQSFTRDKSGGFTVTLDEAVEVMKAEKKSGKILTIGYQPRMSANIQMIKKIIDSGELGKVYYMQAGGGRRIGIPTPFGTSFIEKDTGGVGAMGDIGTYSLDMLLSAVGYPKPLTVTGYTSDFFGKNPAYFAGQGLPAEYAEKFGVEDFAAGFVRLEGGIMLDFRISWAMHMDTCGDTLILGTEGGLKIPSMGCYNGDLPKPMIIYKTVAGKPVSYEVPKDEAPDLFTKKLRAFVDAVKTGGPAPVPASEIIYNQAIIDGIVKSSKLRHEIEIEIPEI